jgi:uncharacterized protein (DUF302 family)
MQGNIEEFRVGASYEAALKAARRAVKYEGLVIAAELPLSDMLRTQLGFGLGTCTVLLVHCPFLLLEAMVMDAASATMLPVHVTISEEREGAVIRVTSPGMDAASDRAADPVRKTFDRTMRSVRVAADSIKPKHLRLPAVPQQARSVG